MGILLAASALGLVGGAGPAVAAEPGPAAPLAAYSLVAPRSDVPSGLVARAVVPPGAACPDLLAGARRLPMRLRQAPATTGAAFASLQVCERAVPPGTATASVGPTPIPAAMPGRIRRVGIIGDTGCRIAPGEVQDCAGAATWPLARIARRVAASSPDVILYVGDYFYREGACPAAAQPLCAASPPPVGGAPFTDSGNGWQADVLSPLQPMLRAAPIVALRGNHEACRRGGNGFFLLLDPRPATAAFCAPVPGPGGALAAPTPGPSPTYAVDLPVAPGRTLRLAMVDSADGSDTSVTPEAIPQRAAYAAASRLAAPAPGREAWLLTHRPILAHVTTRFSTGSPTWTPWTSLDQQAASAGLLGRFSLVLSSHLHLAQAVQIPGAPAQLVVGNGGTLLDPPDGYATPAVGPLTNPLTGAGIVPGVPPYPPPVFDWSDVRFGYGVARPGPAAGRWTITMRDDAGDVRATCLLTGRNIACTPAPG